MIGGIESDILNSELLGRSLQEHQRLFEAGGSERHVNDRHEGPPA
jgi:hypothetical protein